MNKKKAIINIATSTIFKLILLVTSLLLRRYLLIYLGNEAVGLFSLYTSIIGFLSIAELGVGTAITFSMYKPLVEKDYDKVSGLYYLYRKIYMIIFIIVLVVGISITPFIPMMANENTSLFNIYLTYLIFLSATITTYLYAHKTSFINANLDNYLTVTIRSAAIFVESILQIVILIFVAKSNPNLGFNLFMLVLLGSNLIQWFITNIVFKKRYKQDLNDNKQIPKELKKDVLEKTKAMFFHKIGGVLVNTTDSIVISAFISVTVLGMYTNYVTLVIGLMGVLTLVFSSITSIIGQSYASNDKKIFYNQFKYIYLINVVFGFIFFLGFYAVIDDAILILFSRNNDLIMNKEIVIVITLSYFIQFMRHSVLSFKDASGTFYNDRYKPLIEGIVNLTLSLIFVYIWGVAGVLIATILTNILITHIIEPYVLYKYAFKESPRTYYIKNYIIIILFIAAMYAFNSIPIRTFDNLFISFLIKGFISVAISLSFLFFIYVINKDFRKRTNYLIKTFFKMIKGLIKKNI